MIKLITDVTFYYSTFDNELIKQQGSIIPEPKAKSLIVGFCQHSLENKEIAKEVEEYIKQDIGVVYICDILPKHPIVDERVVYVVVGWKWFTHLIFFNPLIFRGYFTKGKGAIVVGKQFSSFLEYTIPKVNKNIMESNKVLVELVGGVGDCLMTIPTLKFLSTKDKKEVHVLCPRGKQDCFKNLEFVNQIFTTREGRDVSIYDRIYLLNFGTILNDYGRVLNQQQRVFAIANLCGIKNNELEKVRPIINLKQEEIDKYKYLEQYNNKIFFGYDSARSNNKISFEMAQNIINRLSGFGYNVIISSLKKRNFKNCIEISGETQIRDLFSIVYTCDKVLTIDTSYLHIAQAFNKKIFVLTNYFPANMRVVDNENVKVYEPNIDCFPCYGGQRVNSVDMRCHQKSCFSYFDWNKILEDIRLELK
jgi:ADP-heptose:LPS heptosyltransferase